MQRKIDGLEDSDKIFITVALWISAIALFAAAITLPMLPERVYIFYTPVDAVHEPYSKYNNLLLTLSSVITAAIIFIVASFKKRGHLQRNFPSILLFCIILSACMGGVTIYGIVMQFRSSGMLNGSIEDINTHQIISLSICLLFSMMSAILPMIIHSDKFVATFRKRSMYSAYVYITLDRFWNVGAYGYLLAGVVASFIPGLYSYIVLAAAISGFLAFVLVAARLGMKHRLEVVLFDAIEN